MTSWSLARLAWLRRMLRGTRCSAFPDALAQTETSSIAQANWSPLESIPLENVEHCSVTDDKPNNLTTHATLHPITGKDTGFDLSRTLVWVGGGVLSGAAIVKLAPHVKAWWESRLLPAWNDRALPAMQSRIRNLFRRKGCKRGALQDEPAETTDAPALPLTQADAACTVFIDQVDALSGEPGTPMSQAEAEEHLFAILIMAANIAERLRALSGARVESEDSERVELLSEAIRQLSTQRIADGINRLLESDTALLDEATVDQFMKLFKGTRIPGQGYAPIRVEQLQEALRLEG